MIFEALLIASKCRREDLQSAKAPYEKIVQDENISGHEKTKAERMLVLFNYI